MIIKLDNKIIFDPDVIEIRYETTMNKWFLYSIKGTVEAFIASYETKEEANATLWDLYESTQKEMPY